MVMASPHLRICSTVLSHIGLFLISELHILLGQYTHFYGGFRTISTKEASALYIPMDEVVFLK